ncbi:hypothetical protein CALVIDRAFT_562014 [Calocera viscosa TUFC12733]|uniref:C2H2-type domain-containing protein n=1 Tax=Calocera viscosa (strain TUFC12733) TaxID=1330018 RepID=A0A167P9Q6_CALVF|nr:hypothetical protein CALVIDRAFT_562014 [Calocera viscosa TUFC12733]
MGEPSMPEFDDALLFMTGNLSNFAAVAAHAGLSDTWQPSMNDHADRTVRRIMGGSTSSGSTFGFTTSDASSIRRPSNPITEASSSDRRSSATSGYSADVDPSPASETSTSSVTSEISGSSETARNVDPSSTSGSSEDSESTARPGFPGTWRTEEEQSEYNHDTDGWRGGSEGKSSDTSLGLYHSSECSASDSELRTLEDAVRGMHANSLHDIRGQVAIPTTGLSAVDDAAAALRDFSAMNPFSVAISANAAGIFQPASPPQWIVTPVAGPSTPTQVSPVPHINFTPPPEMWHASTPEQANLQPGMPDFSWGDPFSPFPPQLQPTEFATPVPQTPFDRHSPVAFGHAPLASVDHARSAWPWPPSFEQARMTTLSPRSSVILPQESAGSSPLTPLTDSPRDTPVVFHNFGPANAPDASLQGPKSTRKKRPRGTGALSTQRVGGREYTQDTNEQAWFLCGLPAGPTRRTEVCAYVFTDENSLNRHVTFCHAAKEWEDLWCGKKERDQLIFGGAGLDLGEGCAVCGLVLSRPDAISRHEKSKHTSNEVKAALAARAKGTATNGMIPHTPERMLAHLPVRRIELEAEHLREEERGVLRPFLVVGDVSPRKPKHMVRITRVMVWAWDRYKRGRVERNRRDGLFMVIEREDGGVPFYTPWDEAEQMEETQRLEGMVSSEQAQAGSQHAMITRKRSRGAIEEPGTEEPYAKRTRSSR